MDGSDKHTDLLLIGKTGNGKSATSNSILGRSVFPTAASTFSVTKQIQIEYSEISGRIVKVVDGPGVCDTDLNQGDALDLVVKCVKHAIGASPKGYHSLLIVVRYGGRFTREDQQAVQLLKGIFGSDFVRKFGILVVTHADLFIPEEYGSLQEWCAKQQGVFRSLVDECNNRVVFFDNRNASKMNEQREILFNMVDSLSSRGERYCNEHFMSAERKRQRIQVEAIAPIIREESMMEASLIIQELGRIMKEDPQEQLVRLKLLKKRSDHLQQSIEDQDKKSGVLKDAIANATHISQSVDENIENAKKAIEMQEQTRLFLEEIERIKAEEDRFREEQFEEKKQAEMRIAELERQIDERDSRYQIMQQQMGQRKRSIEDEYHTVSSEQNNNILPLIMAALSAIVPIVLKMISKK